MQKIDRRIERTEQLLKDALVSLIIEKGYEAVTIKDITERANIAYVTFFRHYKEKDELLVKMLEDVVETLASTADEIEPGHSATNPAHARQEGYLIFKDTQQHSRLYRILLSSPGAMPIVKRVKAAIAAKILANCDALYATESAIPIEIFASHLASSLLALIEWWLENEMPYPPERMAEIYSQLVVKGAWDAALDMAKHGL
jgi:AcrR family transcriptional regulator